MRVVVLRGEIGEKVHSVGKENAFMKGMLTLTPKEDDHTDRHLKYYIYRLRYFNKVKPVLIR